MSRDKEQNSSPRSARIGTTDTHRLPSEGDLHKRIHKVFTVTHKCFGDIRHDAGVHLGQPFGFIESHVEPGPGPLWRKPLRNQEVPCGGQKWNIKQLFHLKEWKEKVEAIWRQKGASWYRRKDQDASLKWVFFLVWMTVQGMNRMKAVNWFRSQNYRINT